ncbi:MAG: aminopeptidase [Gammaproteobacteria bacterium]
MKIRLIAGFAFLLFTTNTTAQDPDLENIAQNIITQVAKVQPGEIVLIRGSGESLEIVEELVAATFIAGGHAIPTIDFPEARIKIAQESPMEYLLQERKADLALLEVLDVIIDATPGFTSRVMSLDIPMERRFAAQDGRATYFEAVADSSHRQIYLGQSSGVPSLAFTQDIGADFEEFTDIFWRAVSVSTEELKSISDGIAEIMLPGTEVHLAGPNGTDLTFTLSNEPAWINTGQIPNKAESGPTEIILPAGEFASCVDISSANGVVYAPIYRWRFQDVYGLTLTFEDGVVTDMSAENGGEALREFLASLEIPSRALSLVNIGLNAESKVPTGSTYRSWEMGGVVTVFMGDNTQSGCGHTADFRLHPQIEGLTLTVGGQPIVIEGEVYRGPP